MSDSAATITFHWNIFFQYLNPFTALQNWSIASGLLTTVYVAVVAQAIGTVIGVVCALGLQSRFPFTRPVIYVYMVYFRGTPLLVQLVLLYFGLSALGIYSFPDLRIGPVVVTGVIQAGILGLGLNEGAFMTEIVRAGLLGVNRGQLEAASALGLTRRQAMRRVVLPQAIRIILPPFGNDFINMIKSTPLIVIIGGSELFNAYEQINGTLFDPFELYLAVSFYYLALVGLWTLAQKWLERRYSYPTGGPSPARRWLGFDIRTAAGTASPLRGERVA